MYHTLIQLNRVILYGISLMHSNHVKLDIISDFKIISSLNDTCSCWTVFKPFWHELGTHDSFLGFLMFFKIPHFYRKSVDSYTGRPRFESPTPNIDVWSGDYFRWSTFFDVKCELLVPVHSALDKTKAKSLGKLRMIKYWKNEHFE